VSVCLQAAGQSVIKPVAFKPIVLTSPGAVASSTQRYTSTPHASRSTSGQCVTSSCSVQRAGDVGTTTTTTGACATVAGRRSTDDGYSSSRGADVNRSSSSEASQSSLLAQSVNGTSVSDHDDAAAADCHKQSGSSSHRASPCTNDLKAALSSKDAELRRLRETMEQNETAIMEVLEERRRGWKAQMTAVTQEWEHKLRCQQQSSFRTEQSLLLQLFKIQQDNRVLRSSRAHNNSTNDELRVAKVRIDELQWELRERTSEVEALTAQLESCSSQLDATRRAATTDTDSLRARLAAVEDDLVAARGDACMTVERAVVAERRVAAAEDAAQRAERDRALNAEAVESLRAELSRTRAALDAKRDDFERQREQWLDEKRRVIDYQKQLQLNYVQIARKNKLLEADVHQLTAEIERHESLSSLTGALVDESLC